ncbi:hypothetical protein RB595_006964 [Gaeumannomyces hyphopodioides]
MGVASPNDGASSSVQARLVAAWHSLRDAWARAYPGIKPYLPPVNFITIHYSYFIFFGLVMSAVFFALSDREDFTTLSFIDSWFLIMSSFTGSGLNTVNLSDLVTGQQAIMFLMMILGSPILIAESTILVRLYYFAKRFEHVENLEREKHRRRRATGAMVGMAGAMAGLPVMSSFGADQANASEHVRRAKLDAFELSKPNRPASDRRSSHFEDNDATPGAQPPTNATTPTAAHPHAAVLQNVLEGNSSSPLTPGGRGDHTTPSHAHLHHHNHHPPQLARAPTARVGGLGGGAHQGFDFRHFVKAHKSSIGRNGQFFDLDEDQREYLGGVEYRSLKLLFVINAVYFFLWQALGAIALGAWMATYSREICAVNRQDPWWTGVFLAVSAFNNAGMTLLDAGIAAFNRDPFVLTIVTILSLAGNAAFPAFVRGIVYVCRLAFKYGIVRYGPAGHDYGAWEEAFDFVLKYPRRLFMLMFPSRQNLVFVGFFSTLVAVNWVGLVVLNIGNSQFDDTPNPARTGIMLFQAIATPSSGLAVFSISGLWFGLLVLLLVTMYLAAYPEIIVMRNSNVYEERSLGLYSAAEAQKQDEEEDAAEAAAEMTAIAPLLSATSVAGSHTTALSKSMQPIKSLAAVGRRGTAFVGKQIQRRMNDFQGVGIDTTSRRDYVPIVMPGLKRSEEINFDGPPPVAAPEGGISLVSQHLRGQLSHDMWSIALALFLIALIETSHSIVDPQGYSVFNFLFEIVSGYTNIGISVGLTGKSFSFCGGWFTGSKVVMVLMMIRGRHRGLPVALDHSVKLPGWDDAAREDQDAEIRRTISRARTSVDVHHVP